MSKPSIEDLDKLFRLDSVTGKLYWKVKSSIRIMVGDEAGHLCNTHGYIFIGVRGRSYRAHCIVWALLYGVWPEHEIDHINRIRSDNRPENLRAATHEQNSYNSKIRSDNTSGFRGVCFDKNRNKWRANLSVNKKTVALGRFDSKELAIEAYRAAALAAFGEFAPNHVQRRLQASQSRSRN